MLGASVDDAVEVLEPGLFEDTRVHVVLQRKMIGDAAKILTRMLLTFEVVVVERDANAVQSKTFKEDRIFLLEKILKEL